MLHRVLAASDASSPAEHAVAVAAALAGRLGAELEVIAVDTAGLPARAGIHGVLGDSFAVPVTWARGIPGIEIVRRAQGWPADLVVLGRPPRLPGQPVHIGPTAEAVIRRRNGLTLFVPTRVTAFRKMLIALDGTVRGLGVLDGAARLFAAPDMQATAICVRPIDVVPATGEGTRIDPVTTRLTSALDRFPQWGGSAALNTRHGSAVEGILDALEEHEADLLVLGVRGGGPKGEMGSGHVGRDLLQATPVAILSVPI
ncbi:MAG TPA: universal stress protein [Gemmatimonadales bacterium]|nr:universal stress protein [Gemmatimonadales bacterium]